MLRALTGSNLALGFVLLPRQKRRAMSVLYAFCRAIDDIADDIHKPVAVRREELAAWRADVRRTCEGQQPQFPVNQQLKPIVEKYRLPFELFDELLKGVEMDLDQARYESWDALELYCYRVASVVGLLSIQIFEYRDPRSRDYAINLGKALQLTNILRDVRTDAQRGRIYLPLGELAKCNVAPEEIFQYRYSDRFFTLATAVAARAKQFYQLASHTLPAIDRRSMIAAELMGAIYWELLRKMERKKFDVFSPEKTQLSNSHKLLLICRTWLNVTLGLHSTNYGAK